MIWTDAEIAFLRENHGRMSWADMGVALKRNPAACQQKLLYLDRKPFEPEPWPSDMPSFEDHPDASDPVKDRGLRGRTIHGPWPYRPVVSAQSSMGDRQC